MSDFKSLLTFKIEKDGNEFHAWCPELVGCHTHSETEAKALENLKDAVQFYLDTILKDTEFLSSTNKCNTSLINLVN